jgi:hypothetical protein
MNEKPERRSDPYRKYDDPAYDRYILLGSLTRVLDALQILLSSAAYYDADWKDPSLQKKLSQIDKLYGQLREHTQK